MTKTKKKRKSKHNPRSSSGYAGLTKTKTKSSHASVYDFTDDGVEQEDRKTASKYIEPSPEENPVDKYVFLEVFRRGSTASEIDSDVGDNFVGNKRQDVEKSPGALMKSLSISFSTPEVACSTRGNAGVCNTEKKNKQVLCLESDDDDDGKMDLQTSTHLDLTEDRGVSEEMSSPHGSDVIDCEPVVVVSPAYVKLGKVYYTTCRLTFSSISISLTGGSPLHERKNPRHLNWSTFDIVRIEHQPCKSAKANVLNFHFKTKDTSTDESCNENSGILDLEFVVDENQWYEKQREIKSLDVKYEGAWETIISECGSNELFDDIVYPEGDPYAVSLSSRDVELLRPMAFLNDTIIDFYIKYLITNTKPEVQHRCHFFNTFFFRKLADMDKSTSRTWDARKAFQRVRKWTKSIEIFEKDFIFIPVNFSLHWSLIVICHPGKLSKLKENDSVDLSMCPRILHMDSIRGSHGGLEDLIRGYLCEEWRARIGEQDANMFMSIHFDALQLPQQQNCSDCGLFLLHYAELFLEQTANFRNQKYPDFLNEAWFLPAEVSLKKRDHIRKLISSLAKEKVMKDPQVASNETLSTVINEGDSSVEIVNWRDVKEACDGMKFNSVTDGTKMQQSFDDLLEQENCRQPVDDESLHQSEQVLSISQPIMKKMPIEIKDIEKHSSLPRHTRGRSEADEDKKPTTPYHFMVGEIEVPTFARSAGCSPVIFHLDDDEYPGIEITSPSKKMKVEGDYCSVLSEEEEFDDLIVEEEFDNLIVEDSEEESVSENIRRARRMSCTR